MIQSPTSTDLTANLTSAIVAAGALGTTAFVIVENLKGWAPFGEAGYTVAMRILGPLTNTLKVAYGDTYDSVLRAQYRGSTADFRRSLRQAIRVGLNAENASEIAGFLKAVSAPDLLAAVQQPPQTTNVKELNDKHRAIFGRFELAADARVDAAMTMASVTYGSFQRRWATIIAIAISVLTAVALKEKLIWGLLVGIAAIPLAPIAKDLASGISAAATALKARR